MAAQRKGSKPDQEAAKPNQEAAKTRSQTKGGNTNGNGVGKNSKSNDAKEKDKIAKRLQDAEDKYDKGTEEQRESLKDQVTTGGTDGRDPDKMDGVERNDNSDQKEFPHVKEEGWDDDELFVDDKQNQPASPSTENPPTKGTNLDEVGHVSGYTKTPSGKDPVRKVVDVFKGRNGKWYCICQEGPEHSGGYTWVKCEDGEEQLKRLKDDGKYYESRIRPNDNNDKIAKKGNIARILGVATENNIPLTLWKKDDKGRLRAPWMRVLVRWGDKDTKSWEWRGDAKGYMFLKTPSRSTWRARKTITYKGETVLEEGKEIHPADFDIFMAAVLYQEQFDQWKAGGRRFDDNNRERTPAPVSSQSGQNAVVREEEL